MFPSERVHWQLDSMTQADFFSDKLNQTFILNCNFNLFPLSSSIYYLFKPLSVLSICLSLSYFLFLFLSLSLCITRYEAFFLQIYHYVFLSLSPFLSLSLDLSFCLSVSLYVCLSLPFSYLSVCLSVSFSFSCCLTRFLYLSHGQTLASF